MLKFGTLLVKMKMNFFFLINTFKKRESQVTKVLVQPKKLVTVNRGL